MTLKTKQHSTHAYKSTCAVAVLFVLDCADVVGEGKGDHVEAGGLDLRLTELLVLLILCVFV